MIDVFNFDHMLCIHSRQFCFFYLITNHLLKLYIVYILQLTADVPAAPDAPQVRNPRRDAMLVEWKPPRKNGGSEITGYIVDIKEKHSVLWRNLLKTNTTGNKKIILLLIVDCCIIDCYIYMAIVISIINTPSWFDLPDCKASGLCEGLEYQFRVCAVNQAGQSDFSEPSPGQLALEPVGM